MVDGRLGPEQPRDLPVGEDVPVVFNQYVHARRATTWSRSRSTTTRSSSTTTAGSRCPVREHLNVLLVDGHFKSEPFQAETDYLAQALSPAPRRRGRPR